MNYRTEIWEQWNRQELARLRVNAQIAAYIELNNLYLGVERGDIELDVSVANTLRILVSQAYDKTDYEIMAWWLFEFVKLPGWLDV